MFINVYCCKGYLVACKAMSHGCEGIFSLLLQSNQRNYGQYFVDISLHPFNQHSLFSTVFQVQRSRLPSKNFLCISMDMLQIGALVLVGRLVEAKVLSA